MPIWLQQNVEQELPDGQAGFKEVEELGIKWIVEKANTYFYFMDCTKAFDCVDHRGGSARPLYWTPEKTLCGSS